MMETDFSGSSICNTDQEELLKSAKVKMGEVREENEKLKKLLAQIAMDYKSLEKQISSIAQSTIDTNSSNIQKKDVQSHSQDLDHLVSLTLGSWNSNKKCEDDNDDTKKRQSSDNNALNKRRKIEGGELELGLDNYCKIEKYVDARVNDSITLEEKKKEEEKLDTRSPSRGTINSNEMNKMSGNTKEGDEESLQQPLMKKTRVCIRSRCDTPTMNDGCQWRKYGQKIAKGNPCPRAYYRCTVSPTCPVRKQVQRYAEDMSIFITTYEGTHNHPLPLSATAMASATSAAASMLKSGSLTSQSTLLPTTTTTTNNHPTTTTTSSSFGLQNSANLMYPFNTNARLSFPNPSMISSSSHSHPTITLDLTTPNSGLGPFDWLSSSSSSSPSLFSSTNYNNSSRKSSSFLNFSSPSLNFNNTSNPPISSTSWASGYFNYGSSFPFNNINNNNNVNNMNNTIRHMNYQNPSSISQQEEEQQQTLISKAIASNPNFQSVLAAAISTYVGNNNIEAKKVSSSSTNDQPQGGGGSNLMLFPSSSTLLPWSSKE